MKVLRRFKSGSSNLMGLCIVIFIILVAATAPWLAPPDNPDNPSPVKYLEAHNERYPLTPYPGAPLGTVMYYHQSEVGMVTLMHFDVFHSLIWGTRSALSFGLITALSAGLIGLIIGAWSGYVGGVINRLVMRITDAFLAFPVITGVLLFRIVIEFAGLELIDLNNYDLMPIPETLFQKLVITLNIDHVMITLILFSWMAYARVLNANVIALKKEEFFTAAKAMGASNSYIVFRHLLPNAITPALVLLARDIGGLVVLQAAFAFIGVSGTTTSLAMSEWSRLLVMGREWVIGQGGNPLLFWWTYVPVTLALVIFGMGWNMLGDGINAALNPRTHNKTVGLK